MRRVIMENLSLNLKIFYVEDGESYYILAENIEHAREYYENSGCCIDESTKKDIMNDNETDNFEDYYTIEEVPKDTECEIVINEEEDLVNIINRYKSIEQFDDEDNEEDYNSLNIYLYAKYIILEKEIRCEKLELPMMIAGSVY
jgi:hypothetical protein